MTALSGIMAPSVLVHAFLWLFGFVVLFRIRRLDEEGAAGPQGSFPSISVIVPARNEAGRLPVILRSLQNQTLRHFEIIVVDDHSTDKTASVAEEMGAKLVRASALPTGWKGKTWACHEGAQRSAGDILVFLDADVFLAPRGLEMLVATHRNNGGVVSVQPYHEIKRPYENFSAVFNLIQTAASNEFTIFGRRVREKRLFGPVLVVGREIYRQSGGHEAVKDAVVENFAMSKSFIARDVPINCFRGEGAVSYRMYGGGVREMFDGWTRSIGTGAHGTSAWVMVAIVCWLTGGLGTVRHLIIDFIWWNGSHLPWLVAMYLLFALQFWRFFRQLGRFSAWASILYPLPVLFFVGVFLRSIFFRLSRRAVSWRGRQFST